MARPGGKEVGRVNIRAVPDGTKFRKDLKVMLERAERTTSLSLVVQADTSSAESALRRFQKDWNGQKISLGVAATTAAAAASLARVSRTRFVPLIVQVSKASVAKASAVIASLSGLRVTGDLIENVVKKLENLDRALPKAALVTASVTSVVSLITASLGGLVTLGGGLADVLGLAAAAPGILTGVAVGGLAVGLALVDVKKQLAVLAPGFQRLQNVVSDNFWAVARGPIIDFVRATLPELRDGLANTAAAAGSWSSTVVESIQTAFGGGRITAMFAPLISSIEIAATGALGFAQAVAVLGQVGGSFLPRLAQWVADLSNRFGAYLLQIEASGALARVIETGITAAQQLGSSLASIVSILGGIESAAQSAGGGGLASFAAVLATVAGIVNGPAFQTTLSAIFTGASAGAAGLASALGPIGALLSTLAPVLSGVLAGAGAVVGEVLGQIATALQAPAFSTGLALFFEGLLDGIQAVAPALPALAAAFGAFLGFAGKMASVLGPVLGTVLQALAPVFTSILTAVQPLLPILGDALISIVGALAPIFSELVTSLLPPIIAAIAQLVPMLMPIVQAILPILSALLPPIAALIGALLPILQPILALLGPIFDLLGPPIIQSLQILTPLLNGLGTVLTIVANIISAVLGTAIELLVGLISGDMSGALDKIGKIWSDVWTNISTVFTDVWNGIQDVAKVVFNYIANLIGGFVNSVIDNVNGLLSGLGDIASGIASLTGGAISIKFAKLPHVSIPNLAVGADILPTPGGTLARLAERNRPETVTDLGHTNRLIAAANALANRALGGSSGDGAAPGQQFNVYPPAGEDPRVTARAWAREYGRRA